MDISYEYILSSTGNDVLELDSVVSAWTKFTVASWYYYDVDKQEGKNRGCNKVLSSLILTEYLKHKDAT